MNLKNTDFNKFRADIKAALEAVAAKYDCDVDLGKIKYDENSINISIDFNAKGENGESGEQALFNRTCAMYGFSPEDYNKPFTMDEKVFRLTGFNPKARKYHCLITDNTGKVFGATMESVQLHLHK